MSLNGQKSAQMSLNKSETSWTNLIDFNEPKSSIDPKYIQNDPIWAQNEPKWAQTSLNELSV